LYNDIYACVVESFEYEVIMGLLVVHL